MDLHTNYGRRGMRAVVGVAGVGAALAVAAACTPVAPITQAAGGGSGTVQSTNPRFTAPTDNLTRLANDIVFKDRSVTTQISTFPGLALTHRVTIGIAYEYGAETTTVSSFDYDNAHGNRVVHNIPGNTGARIPLVERVTLTEHLSATATKQFVFSNTVSLRPLFDVTFSPLTFELTDYPTSYVLSGTVKGSLQWNTAQGVNGWQEFVVGTYRTPPIVAGSFAQTYRNVGEGETDPVRYPGISFFLQNPASPIPTTNFVNDGPGPGAELFEWTGGAQNTTYRRVIPEVISNESGNPVAHGRISYTITRLLDTYPSL